LNGVLRQCKLQLVWNILSWRHQKKKMNGHRSCVKLVGCHQQQGYKETEKHTVVERKENQENSGEGYTTEKDIA